MKTFILLPLVYMGICETEGDPCAGIPGGTVVDDRCIWLSPVIDKGFDGARIYCDSVKPGADLAIIDSPQKSAALAGIASTMPDGSAVLGLRDLDPGICRDRRWLDGRPVTIQDLQNYKTGEPDSISLVDPASSNGFEDCTFTYNNFVWWDAPCHWAQSYAICECCYNHTEIKMLFVKHGPSHANMSGEDLANQARCAVRCEGDAECCSFRYDKDTKQCHLDNQLTGPGRFVREHADQP